MITREASGDGLMGTDVVLKFLGSQLQRPESVLATSDGRVFASDHECGVVQIGGERHPLLDRPVDFVPNGIALLPDGDFLCANLGSTGGVWRIGADRRPRPFILEVEGRQLCNTNSVALDDRGRIWVSICTRRLPRFDAFDPAVADGFIVLIEGGTARVVADGLAFANECRVGPDGGWLYVNESIGRRLSRFALREGAAGTELAARETVHEFSDGEVPDGLNFDDAGGVWVACPVANRVIRVDPNGGAQLIVSDTDAELASAFEKTFAAGRVDLDHIAQGAASILGNVSSIAFGNADLRTVYLGSLAGGRIASFRTPWRGAVPAHWPTVAAL